MADLTGAKKMAAWTPYRTSEVVFDRDEVVHVEKPFGLTRWGENLSPDFKDGISQNIELLASGYWILKPYNWDFSKAQLTTDFGTIRLSEWTASTQTEEIAKWRKPSELTGALTGASGDLSTQGDWWIRRRILSSGSFDDGIDGALEPVTLPSAQLAMQTVLRYNGVLPAQQGYIIRWTIFDRMDSHPDTLFTFYFGGPIEKEGFRGQYAITVSANGMMILFEQEDASTWTKRAEWEYSPPALATFGTHTIRIIPHAIDWIEFRHTGVGSSYESLPLDVVLTRTDRAFPYHLEYDSRDRKKPRPTVTGAGTPQLDVRRDLKIDFQINKVLYTTGSADKAILRDHPIDIGLRLASSPVLESRFDGFFYQNPETGVYYSQATMKCWDPKAAAYISTTTESYTDPISGGTASRDGFIVPTPKAIVQIQMEWYTDANWISPVIQGYNLYRQGTTIDQSNGEETASATEHIREINIAGQEGQDSTQGSAHIDLIDRVNTLTKIDQRASIPVVVRTSHLLADPTNKVVIFKGFCERANGTQKGTPTLNRRGGTTSAYKDWKNYDLTCRGMWLRLHEYYIHHGMVNFANASQGPEGVEWQAGRGPEPPKDPATGLYYPWKFTDILKTVFDWAGFTKDQIDIPDNPLRPWLDGDPGSIETLRFWPYTNVGEYVEYICTSFLGGWMIFDPMAGTADGMWRFRRFPDGTEPIRWNFTSTPAAAGKLPHRLDSYAALTSPIKRGSLTTYIVPPEGNRLTVSTLDRNGSNDQTALRSTRTNDVSCEFPDSIILPDPTDPDYLGRIVDIVYLDTLLGTQEAVDYVATRVANIALRGYRVTHLTSHLVFIDPSATDSYYSLGTYRSLLFGDLVKVDGVKHMVRGVNPAYRHDRIQLASYELQEWREEMFT